MINRKKFLSTSLKGIAAGATSLSLFPKVIARPSPMNTIKGPMDGSRRLSGFQELRRNVGLFTGRGGTIGWLYNSEALVAIDTQFPDTAETFINGLTERGASSMDLLVNSHHHNDHTAGNGVFAPFAQHIIAHENVPTYQRNSHQDSDAKPITADQRFSSKWSGDFGDETLHLMHYGAAHTGGDTISFFEKAQVAHLGDLVFNRAYPYIDPSSGASVQNWVRVLNTIVEELPKDTIYIFGHGHPEFGITGTWEDINRKKAFLEELLTLGNEAIMAGKSKEEFAQMEVIPGFEEFAAPGWRLPLSYNLNIVYDELLSTS